MMMMLLSVLNVEKKSTEKREGWRVEGRGRRGGGERERERMTGAEDEV